MSVIFATGLLQESAAAASGLKTDTRDTLAACIADIVDGRGDTVIEALAVRALNRVIRDLNLSNRYLFMRDRQADLDLVAAQSDYALDDEAFMVDDVQLLNSDGEIYRTLQYVPWSQHNRLEPHQATTGLPVVWTIRTRYDYRYITVYPIPTSDEATYDLRVNYKKRLSEFSENGAETILNCPPELSEVLCRGGEWYMLRWRDRNNTPFLDRIQVDYERAKLALESLDRAQDDEPLGFQLHFEG